MKFLFAILLISSCISAQITNVSSGKIVRLNNVQSKYVDERNVDIWLPNDYSYKEKYAVIYMHDGQMLFDAQNTWNKQAWEMDETASKLINNPNLKKFIIVGIWNISKNRHSEYFPQNPFEDLNEQQKEVVTQKLINKGKINSQFIPNSNNYLKFIVTELKPYIDKNYATIPNSKNTFIAGSSMGGLISIYAICQYPNVFGGAACLSSHWPGIFDSDNNPIPETFYSYLKNNLPNPKSHKIYFDYGDQTLDALYPPLQKEVDKIMIQKGFNSKNWITKFFPGKDHSEIAWAERVHIPLEFLLKK
jgi:predicted alpha/beta superfamily hydrolase